MAPEMALGETVDGRADIYALGCVAYFLLTGRLVFEAENTFQMVAKHMRNQPVPPSVRGSVEVPAALEKLVLQCLAKKPEERPANAGVVREMLESIAVKSWSDADAREWWTMKAQPLASATVPMFGGSVRAGALAVT
jgi:serine/threonine-protein kinase